MQLGAAQRHCDEKVTDGTTETNPCGVPEAILSCDEATCHGTRQWFMIVGYVRVRMLDCS